MRHMCVKTRLTKTIIIHSYVYAYENINVENLWRDFKITFCPDSDSSHRALYRGLHTHTA